MTIDSVDFLLDPIEAEINAVHTALPNIDVLDAVVLNEKAGKVIVDIRENYLTFLTKEEQQKTINRVLPLLKKLSDIKARTDQNALNLGDGIQVIFFKADDVQ